MDKQKKQRKLQFEQIEGITKIKGLLSSNVKYFGTPVAWYALDDVCDLLNVDSAWLYKEISTHPLFDGRTLERRGTFYINQAGISIMGYVYHAALDATRYTVLLHAVDNHSWSVMEALRQAILKESRLRESLSKDNEQLRKSLVQTDQALSNAKVLLAFKQPSKGAEGGGSVLTQYKLIEESNKLKEESNKLKEDSINLQEEFNKLKEHIASIRKQYSTEIKSLKSELIQLRPYSLMYLLTQRHKQKFDYSPYCERGIKGIEAFLHDCDIPLRYANMMDTLSEAGIYTKASQKTYVVTQEYLELLPESTYTALSLRDFEYLLYYVTQDNTFASKVLTEYLATHFINNIKFPAWNKHRQRGYDWLKALPQRIQIPDYKHPYEEIIERYKQTGRLG